MAFQGFRDQVAWIDSGRSNPLPNSCLDCTAVQLPVSETLTVGHGACDRRWQECQLVKSPISSVCRVHNFPIESTTDFPSATAARLTVLASPQACLSQQPACCMPAVTASQPAALSPAKQQSPVQPPQQGKPLPVMHSAEPADRMGRGGTHYGPTWTPCTYGDHLALM